MQVETLLMRGTAEEEMFWLQHAHEAPPGGGASTATPPGPGSSSRLPQYGSAAEGPDAIVFSSVTLQARGGATGGVSSTSASAMRPSGQLGGRESAGRNMAELGRVLLRHLHNVALQELPTFEDPPPPPLSQPQQG